MAVADSCSSHAPHTHERSVHPRIHVFSIGRGELVAYLPENKKIRYVEIQHARYFLPHNSTCQGRVGTPPYT